MEDKEAFKLWIRLLSANDYLAWFNDMEMRKGLWKFVERHKGAGLSPET